MTSRIEGEDKNKSEILFMDDDRRDEVNGRSNKNTPVENLQLKMRNPGSSRTSPLFDTENHQWNNNNSRPNYGIEVEDMEPTRVRHKINDDDDDKSFDNGLTSRPLSPRSPSNGAIVIPQVPFDVNVYQQKKTLAQGMMDLALISSNANQLRYVLSSRGHPFFLASLIMISMSLILQIVVGIGLIWNSRYDVKEDAEVHQANRANNWTVIAIFLVTILNVFVSSFGVIDQADVIIGSPYLSRNTTDEFELLRYINSTTNDNATSIS